MKVKVTRLGFHNMKRVKPGQVLEIDPKEFSSKWMESMDGKPAASLSGGSKKSAKPVPEVVEVAEESDVI